MACACACVGPGVIPAVLSALPFYVSPDTLWALQISEKLSDCLFELFSASGLHPPTSHTPQNNITINTLNANISQTSCIDCIAVPRAILAVGDAMMVTVAGAVLTLLASAVTTLVE